MRILKNMAFALTLAVTIVATMSVFVFLGVSDASAAPKVGEPAPLFEGNTAGGEVINLEQYRGKTVVLEWTNHQCPYVIKHYDSGNMQKLQKAAIEDDVVWLSIASSAPGKQGYVDGPQALDVIKQVGAHSTERILDPTGKIGRLYDAKTTPHMFVIDAKGTLVYQGAIDDNTSSRASAVDGATNYVVAALDALKNGKRVDPASTKPYGCSVKY